MVTIKEFKLFFDLTEWYLIPQISEYGREMKCRFLFFTVYILKTKKKNK